jgi:hypothetical protein
MLARIGLRPRRNPNRYSATRRAVCVFARESSREHHNDDPTAAGSPIKVIVAVRNSMEVCFRRHHADRPPDDCGVPPAEGHGADLYGKPANRSPRPGTPGIVQTSQTRSVAQHRRCSPEHSPPDFVDAWLASQSDLLLKTAKYSEIHPLCLFALVVPRTRLSPIPRLLTGDVMKKVALALVLVVTGLRAGGNFKVGKTRLRLRSSQRLTLKMA